MPLTFSGLGAIPPGIVLANLPVGRVLYEAEAPVLYLTSTVQGQSLLAYVADDAFGRISTLLSPISPHRLEALEQGTASVRDVLTSSWMWLHVLGGEETGLWAIDPEKIPEEYLPLQGTPLLPEHEPVLRTRAVGKDVVLGRMPASVVAFVADATRRAMKVLLDHTFALSSDGRPRREHQALYDLPVQSFAFSSFEISFSAPSECLFPREQVQQAAALLEKGLSFASGEHRPLVAANYAEREAVLSATLLLTPPASGPISEVHVSRSWVKHDKLRLVRDSRKRVREHLRKPDERVVIYTGRIGELDDDNLTFILRDTQEDGGDEHRGSFDEELLEDMQIGRAHV